jgi:hypothetical protein
VEYSKTTSILSSVHRHDCANVTLTLSRRLIAVDKVKDILRIEAGLEMIALAMVISSQVRTIQVFFEITRIYVGLC